jgi:dTDP-4-amino-4,6-dideoxygalactose transaminase/lipopolysaccharide/colanic/teichoic acid biosynthesis glycosyltransferase
MSTPTRLLFVDNDINSFVAYRMQLALAASRNGFEVHVAAPPGRSETTVTEAGLRYHALPMTRKGTSVGKELRTIGVLYRLYREVRPDLIHHLRLKPVLYGGIAARLAGVPAQVSLLTGLGHVFTATSMDARLMRLATLAGCRFAFRHGNLRVVFQNPDDKEIFLTDRTLAPSQTELIRGSGVDMSTFAPFPEPTGTPLVVLPSRMLMDKGINDFVEAARLLRSEGVEARFALVGNTDPGNPTAIPVEQLQQWHDSGVIEWWGFRPCMESVLASANIVCLPSLREGVPKSLIEAAACGRAIVTTDVPGCREIVKHGQNGLLVRPHDVRELANALRLMIENPQLRRRLGETGRRIATAEFSLDRVIAETMTIYNDVLAHTAERPVGHFSDAAKRGFDIAVSSLALVAASPLIAAAALGVKATSRGPVFYKGVRIGKDGREFRILKFRSMVVDAERLGGSATATDDPRITRFGAFLRSTKLDELPQLFNVFRGDMSLVGPRPEVAKYVATYNREQRRILRLRPGITDWATIWNSDEGAVLKGSPHPEKSYEELIRPTKLALQLRYFRERSFATDLKILWSTVMRLLIRGWMPNELTSVEPVMPYTLAKEKTAPSQIDVEDNRLPAILGGQPEFAQKFRFIEPTLPPLDEVVSRYGLAYQDGLITNSNCVARLESAVADRLHASHCVAVSSCTSGLTLAIRAFGLTGEIILPSFTFFATGHAIRWNGLTPVFADIDPQTWNVDLDDIERKITKSTSAILAVHLYGNPANVIGLQALAKRYKLKLIFDAAHGFGSAYRGRPIGQFGDAEVFSMSPTKLLVAGEGGLVTTNNAELAKALRALRNYGDAGNYDPEYLGANARMAEFNAALALSGLPLVDEKVRRRQSIAARYTAQLADVPGCSFQSVHPSDTHTFKDYSVLINPEYFGMTVEELGRALLAENIDTRRYFYPPLHRQKLYHSFNGLPVDNLAHTNRIASNVLSLPIYESLPDSTVDRVAAAIRRLQRYQMPLVSKLAGGTVYATTK